MESNVRLRKALRYIKKNNKNLTNARLAEILGYKSKTYLSSLGVSGVTISDDFLEVLKEKYNISPEWIKTGAGEMLIPNLKSELTELLSIPPNKHLILIAFLLRKFAAFESHYYGELYEDRLKKLVEEAKVFSQQEI